MTFEEQLTALALVALAALFGGIIGLDREWLGKPAGLRTHMLVAAATALFAALGEPLVARYAELYGDSDTLRVDPIALLQAIMVGIGFLGAGTIFQRSDADRVEGLTTAGSLLLAAGVGVAVAQRQVALAFGVVVLAVLVLVGIGAAETAFAKRVRKRHPADDRTVDDPAS